MAEGVLKLSNSDVAISISGIAGPGGGTEEKPVGTICFGFAGKTSKQSCKTFNDLLWKRRNQKKEAVAASLLV